MVKPTFLFSNTKNQSHGNPVLFSHNEKLYNYFVILQDHYWDSAQIYVSVLDEKTNLWSAASKVNTPQGLW
jgi:hypothetical protein